MSNTQETAMVALTFVRLCPVADVAGRTPESFDTMKMLEGMHDHVGNTLANFGFRLAEVHVVVDPASEEPRITVQRLIAPIVRSLRDVPLAPELGGATPKQAKDLVALLRRGAAAIETPGDLTEDEKGHVAEDLCVAADQIEHGRDLEILSLVRHTQQKVLVKNAELFKRLADGDKADPHPLAAVLRRAIRAIRRPEEPTQTADGSHDAGHAELLEQLETAAQVYEMPNEDVADFLNGTIWAAGTQTGRFSGKEPNQANTPKSDPADVVDNMMQNNDTTANISAEQQEALAALVQCWRNYHGRSPRNAAVEP